jgi:antitoxin component YwqK of YwqJK toxin-antitoxin module
MKFIIAISLFFVCSISKAQEIVNVVFVGENGVAKNIKDAHSFVIVKQFEESFQRLDYKMHAPLVKERNYSDSALTILHGDYFEYDANGALVLWGKYEKNVKEKSWYHYNDTGKVVLEEKYLRGVLIATINPDTVIKEMENPMKYKDESEAYFGKKKGDWIKYLTKNLNGDVANNSVMGGQVRVAFVVDTTGKCIDIYLRKSVEFVLDEEAKKIIQKSPLWHPAFQNGKVKKAYRIQPIVFAKQ